jgi:hypothetical protein
VEYLKSDDQFIHDTWNDSNHLAVVDASQVRALSVAGHRYKQMLWSVGWTLGLIAGAEHPSNARELALLAAGGGGRSFEVRAASVVSTPTTAASGGSTSPSSGLTSVPTALSQTSVSSTPPAVTTTDVYGELRKRLPPAGQFALIAGSSIADTLVANGDFPFCDAIGCFKAKNAFLAWVGMAFDESRGRWWNPAGGGHADYGGNEIYQFDFRTLSWSRLTDPMPLTGDFMTDPNKDGVMDKCPLPASGPPATHTYDGVTYVPSTDEILLLGTAPYCAGWMTGAQTAWVWSNGRSQWRQLTNIKRSDYMRTVYDSARDRVYMIGGAGQGQFYELDPQTNYGIVREGPHFGWTGNGVAEFDENSRYLYYSASKQGLYRVHVELDGALGPITNVVNWNGDESQPLPVAIHEPTRRVVTWAGDGLVMRTDPKTGTVENLTPTSGPKPSRRNGVIYSKWVYISAVDAFAGIDDAREGVWVYRLPDSSVPPPPPRPPPPSPGGPGGTPNPASSFDQRCSAPGVVFCDPLDTEGPWGVDATGNRRLMRNPDGTTGIPTKTWWRVWRGVRNAGLGLAGHVAPRLDTTLKASGTGSLKFDYPPFSNEGGGGLFTTNFSDDFSQQFGEGDTFYVQFRWRADCDFVYFDCDPKGPNYRKARRFYRSTSGGFTAAKSTIIATGDPRAGVSADACTFLQIVLNHGQDHSLQGYHSCGWYSGFDKPTGETFFGSTQIDFQPNGAVLGRNDDLSPTCWWIPDPSVNAKRSWGNTGPDCFQLEADQWMTIQLMIRIGKWQSERTGPRTSHVTIWGAREGEPQRIIIDTDVYLRAPEEAGQKYGKIWLLPFMTAKDPTEAHPTAHFWYDELIVSREFIADPK